ncbi:VanZ family protein [Vibrio panuliri]|uniref:VanZ-like domain-containing protein n=1 Tax=Vibrio panuliri TaxID=1381081 RepID=A0A1Q9HNH3_9VIBR|nr:VanZ family protein [Vibrio panuliri]KAB1457702.1 VanZ family protein [Vibrio panuliri]OLQ85814.1 hypothetical protein BIY20_03210 [Vibrio panuliri]OLQ92367.1 hypothetical protein BIY22_16275 [Vibrio panuliri]
MHSAYLIINFRAILLLLIAVVAGCASLAKSLNYYSDVVVSIEQMLGGDWALHAIFALVLGFTAHWATPVDYFYYRRFCAAPLLALILFLVVVDEFMQAFIPHREFSWLDLSINVVGLLVGGFLYRLYLYRKGI